MPTVSFIMPDEWFAEVDERARATSVPRSVVLREALALLLSVNPSISPLETRLLARLFPPDVEESTLTELSTRTGRCREQCTRYLRPLLAAGLVERVTGQRTGATVVFRRVSQTTELEAAAAG